MSQTFFSKQDTNEKHVRLSLLGASKGAVTIWIKGSKDKHNFSVLDYDKERSELVLRTKDSTFHTGATLLCTFDLRGMTFFSQVVYLKSIGGHSVLHFSSDLFKSERRLSYRLMTYPLYDVWASFDLGEAYQGGVVVDLKSKVNQTALFKNFLQLVDDQAPGTKPLLRVRVQDLSTTGMALHIGDLETKHFPKDTVFKNVILEFQDESIPIPEAKVVYVVDYLSGDRNIKKYKVGVNFPQLPTAIDDLLGRKINKLLRENDFNKDFENFVK